METIIKDKEQTMNGRTIFRLFLFLMLVALVAAAGFYVYNIGLAQGRVEGAQLSGQQPGGGVVPYYAYGPFFRPFGFGFGLFGLFFLLIPFLFLTRLLIWGPRRHWGRHYSGEGRDLPPFMQEWHRRQHESEPEPARESS
jgi:hypothetical protein